MHFNLISGPIILSVPKLWVQAEYVDGSQLTKSSQPNTSWE